MPHEGTTPTSSLDRRLNAYPVGSSLEEMTDTSVLLDDALEAADPYEGDLDAWLRFQHGSLN